MPLRVELVPSTAWWSNVRSQVTRSQWEVCKRFVRERSNSRCEICGGVGPRHPVECHERWQYDDEAQVQTLVGLIALCPTCHACTHLGRSEAVAKSADDLLPLYLHLMKVNGWTDFNDAIKAIETAYSIWSIRSSWQWGLDVSYLREIGLDLPRYTWGPHERVTV